MEVKCLLPDSTKVLKIYLLIHYVTVYKNQNSKI